MDSDRTLLSVSDAAKRLQRSTEQVRRYLREERLKGQRIGGQWFIDRDVLDAFVANQQAPATFIDRLESAARLRALDSVIGIGSGRGSDIGQGKATYRRDALRGR